MHSLRSLIRHPQFRLGFAESASPTIGISVWGIVMGVAMIQSGLPVPAALLMSFGVYSGGAQLAALPLIAAKAPIWLIMVTAACINLRFVIFSAQWRPHIAHLSRGQRMLWGYMGADVTYVVFMSRFKEGRPGPGQLEYFLGAAVPAWLGWQVCSMLGMLLANVLPMSWGLGFAGVLAMMGLVFSLMHNLTTGLVVVAAGATAVIGFALPMNLNTVVAIIVGVAVGLGFERHAEAAMRRWRQSGETGA